MLALNLPSLQQLRVFEAVARSESISAASKVIHLSQPGVTQAISSLERRVAVTLFDRRRTGCYLTAPGTIFLSRVERLLSQLRQALCEPIVGTPFADGKTVAPLERKLTDAHIRSLVAIADSSSFDEAARRLGISEPSLHRSARGLERVLRRTLYRRTAQGFTTTPQAGELARRFKVATREIEYGIEELNAEQGRFISRIVVGNIPHSDVHLLSTAINDLLAKFPDASVQVIDGHYDDLLAGLRGGQIDVLYGILRRPEWVKDVEEQLLFPNPYAVVARNGHPVTRRAKITVDDLAQYEWIMPPEGTPRRHAFEQVFADEAGLPRVGIETTSMEIYRVLLGTSDRLSLFSRREAGIDKTAGFEILPFQSPLLQRVDGIATRTDWKPTSIHLQFLERLKAHAKDS